MKQETQNHWLLEDLMDLMFLIDARIKKLREKGPSPGS